MVNISKNITNLLTGVISFSTFIAEGEIDKAKEVTINLQNKYF